MIYKQNFFHFKKTKAKREPYPEYANSEVSMIKGVHRDEEAGILRYTMVEKEDKDKKILFCRESRFLKKFFFKLSKKEKRINPIPLA